MWNYEVIPDIPEGNCKNVIIEVFDADKLGKDKSIGKLDLQVAELVNIEGQEGKWFPFSGVKSVLVLLSADLLDALGYNANGVPSSILGRKDSTNPSAVDRRRDSTNSYGNDGHKGSCQVRKSSPFF